jgi:Zn-dependent protease
MAYNPFYEEPLHHAGPPRIAFSRIELLHLVGALALLTTAFTFIIDQRVTAGFDLAGTFDILLHPDGLVWATSFAGMATGFVLHELAHKVVAQRYGHWAEFRATFSFLGITLAAAAFLRILFAAPGAVLIQGRVTPRENGIISLVGPGLNLVVASLTFGAYLAGFYLSPDWAVSERDVAPFLLVGIAQVNALLSMFNLVPVGPLDGRKVLHWNRGVYAVAMALSIALFLAVLLFKPSP